MQTHSTASPIGRDARTAVAGGRLLPALIPGLLLLLL